MSSIWWKNRRENPKETAVGEKRRVRLGEYEVIERIGAGGMGQIFKATQTSLDRVVALKLLPKSMAKDRALVERLYREAKAAAKIVHPNVVQIYSVGEEHGVPYFAMEYVEGEDLEQKLSRGDKFTLEETIDMVAAVAMALSAAAELTIVHRDIKPANIMINKTGVVKVTDFGLAKPAQSNAMNITQAGYIVGTPTYMSPEQAEGAEVDTRSDIYSLGIVFYELLTGLPPFVAESPAALIYKHVHENPRPPSEVNTNVPPELDHIVLKCLSKSPADRYGTAGEFLEDLLAVRKSLGVEAGNTIVFDPSQAERFLERRATPVDSSVSTEPRDTVRAGGRLSILTSAVAAMAVGVVILGAISAYVAIKGTPAQNQPQNVTSKPKGSGAEVDFSFLAQTLPQSSTCMLISKDGSAPLPFSKHDLNEGSYSIKVEKNGYLPFVLTFEVAKGTVKPELKADAFTLEPSPELKAAYDEARQLYEQGNMQGALAAMDRVAGFDPNYKDTASIAASIKKQLNAAAQAREEKWTHATDAFRKGLYEDALGLLKNIETDNPHFTEAQNIIKLAEDRLSELAKLRTACDEALMKGDASTAEKELAGLEKVAGERPAEAKFMAANKKLVGELKVHFIEIERKDLPDPQKKVHLLAILKISPQSKTAKDELEKIGGRIEARTKSEGLMAAAKEQFDKGQFEEARKTIAQAKQLWPEGLDGLAELDEKARLGIVTRDLRVTVSQWEKMLAGKTPDKDPFGLDTALGSETAKFARITPYPITELKLALKDFHETQAAIEGVVDFLIVLSPTPAGTFTMKGTLQTTFAPAETGYLIKVITLGEGDNATGENETGEAGKLVRGSVKAVDGAILQIAVPDPDVIPLGETMLIYSGGEVVEMPYSDKVAIRHPKVVARGRVLKRLDRAIVADTGTPVAEVVIGAVAIYDPLNPVEKTPPRVLSLKTSQASANTSVPVTITAEVTNPDAMPTAYRWETTGGKLQANLTPGPEVLWYPPSDKGSFKVTVRLMSGNTETSTAEASIDGLGPNGELPKSYRSEGALSIGGGMFQDVKDLAFDENNDAYILDNAARTVLVLASGSKRVKAELALPKGEFRKIGVRQGKVYLADTVKSEVVRCIVTDKGLQPEATIGGKGNGNGFLGDAVDFDFLSDGRLVIVDQMSHSVETFAPDGRFLFSVGSLGKSTGNIDREVAITVDAAGDFHVLDAGRFTILTFRNAKLMAETVLPERNIPATDIAYDPLLAQLVVLFENGDVHRWNGTDWAKVVSSGEELGKVIQPSAIGVDKVGTLHIADRKGRAMELFKDDQYLGQLGGATLDRVDRFTVCADGSMYLLDSKNALVGRISSLGAVTSRFGGRGKGAELEAPSVLRAGTGNTLYILDTSRRQVLVYSPDGKLLSTIGQSGRLPAKELLQPVDMFVKGDKVYVLQDTGKQCVHVYSAADGSLLQVFPGANDTPLKSVQAIAVDTLGSINIACMKKPLSVFSPEGGLVATGKTTLPIVNAAAASSDGTIAFLDSRGGVLYVFRPNTEEKLLAVNLASIVQGPLDVSADAFGGLWVLGSNGRLVRLVPVWQ
jgi:serine/threonine protein kinase